MVVVPQVLISRGYVVAEASVVPAVVVGSVDVAAGAGELEGAGLSATAQLVSASTSAVLAKAISEVDRSVGATEFMMMETYLVALCAMHNLRGHP